MCFGISNWLFRLGELQLCFGTVKQFGGCAWECPELPTCNTVTYKCVYLVSHIMKLHSLHNPVVGVTDPEIVLRPLIYFPERYPIQLCYLYSSHAGPILYALFGGCLKVNRTGVFRVGIERIGFGVFCCSCPSVPAPYFGLGRDGGNLW